MSTTYRLAASDLSILMGRMKPATTKPTDHMPLLERVRLTVDDGRLTAMATDRYRLFMDSMPVTARELSAQDEEPQRVFTLPATVADDAKRLARQYPGELVALEVTAQGVTVEIGGTRMQYPAMDAEYPRVGDLIAKAITRIAEGTTHEAPSAYNTDYLADFAKVRRAGGLTKNTPLHVHQIPSGAGCAQLIATFAGTDFWALLMGVRTPEDTQDSAAEALTHAAETARAAETAAA